MADTHHHHHHLQQPDASSRLGIRPPSSTTDIVEVVRGSHIVRSTGRKDRHSKVCTAKGPRDRRVRLAAHTAIQFYDVQDRLGYDRPSKAVDWLIKKAKAAIDELDELPSWHHTISTTTAATVVPPMEAQNPTATTTTGIHFFTAAADATGATNRRTTMAGGGGVSEQIVHNQNNTNSTFLPPSLDSDAIADTIKSFFPMGASAAAETPSSTMQFHHNYPPNLPSRTSSQNQDLRLSLHPFQDPILLHHHHNHHHQNDQQTLFAGTQNPLGFDGSSPAWTDHHHHQQHQQQYQRLVAWNSSGGGNGGGDNGGNGGDGAASSGGGGSVFNSLLPTQSTNNDTLFGQSQFFSSQRGPLQSSNSPSNRAWMIDQQQPSIFSPAIHHQHQHQSSISAFGFVPGGFSGFLPARIHGEEEQHDGISDKPSSASSNSRH